MSLKPRTIAINDELWTKIISLANLDNRSTSQYIRMILNKHLKEIKRRKK